jgi:cobyrinic acid a,c-diamide synthase
VQPQADALALLWGLMDVMDRAGIYVQNYLSRACFAPHFGAASAIGLSARYLDSWLMTPEVCREVFARGARGRDLAVVEGVFNTDDGADESRCGGRLDTLCDWLELPKLVVLSTDNLDACRLPRLPGCTEGVLLDGFRDRAEFARLQTRIETVWGVPVLGGLDRAESLRREIAELPESWAPRRRICERLGARLSRCLDLPAILAIAAQRPFTRLQRETSIAPAWPARKTTIAVAFDDAFRGYFPDVLDVLESHGAAIRVFSPLRDTRLPEGTDIVYLGGGQPECYLRELAANHCMMLDLCDYFWSGGRLYAEAGAIAYLAQTVELPDGSETAMAGMLPIRCRFNPRSGSPVPVEFTLAQNTWLAEGWSRIRGYIDDRWIVEPTGPVTSLAAEPGHELDMIGQQQIVASRAQIHFAGQPELLDGFFDPMNREVDLVG